MSYLSAKKIYPGNFTEALNGWYKNIDTNVGSNDKVRRSLLYSQFGL